MNDTDTICAISTSPGQGGIGIVRMSGKDSHRILKHIFQSKKGEVRLTPRKLILGCIIDPKNKRVLDEVLVVRMPAPHTYTRQPMAEIYCHGGYGAQQAILSAILTCGVRLAEPGEFTKRAFLNGRIDLTQAESVLAVIRSETEEELHHAVKHLRGGLYDRIEGFRKTLKNVLVSVEASLDFPDEDLDIDHRVSIKNLENIRNDIKTLVDSYYTGKGISHGFEVLITGRTNVGKSSLLNKLLSKNRAIVTPHPGTTRDLIEDVIYMKGIKIRFIDTAGIREACDSIEEEGIRRVKEKMADADLIIWLLDGSQPYSDEDDVIFNKVSKQRYLAVINKSDLPSCSGNVRPEMNGLYISALTGAGLDDLKEAIHKKLTSQTTGSDGLIVMNTRQRDILKRVDEGISRVFQLDKNGEPLELISLEIRDCLHNLGKITGETYTEEILEDIFNQFCIGK